MDAVTEMPSPFVFTDNAAGKVRELIEEEGNPDLKLSVFVQGGGCSGFQYGLTFDESVNEDDTAMEKNDVHLLFDSMSYKYLIGAAIVSMADLTVTRLWISTQHETPTYVSGTSFSG